MSSGSLKDLSKAVSASVSSSSLTLPLPEHLLHVIQAYLEKHADHDESDSQRLHDELLSLYQSLISEDPTRLAPFLEILRLLRPILRGSRRLIQWWDKLSNSVIVHLGVQKGLATEAREVLLEALIYEEDEEGLDKEDAQATSLAVADNLIATWLAKNKIANEEFNDHAIFMDKQLRLILFLFGKRRPKDFLTALNKFVVKKDTRIVALSLLCEFFRDQPPHLHQLLQTPLFENILKCLQRDTSTRTISLAMTALIMFLPHIPSTASQHLPALFNIYGRMLFWDRERKAIENQPAIKNGNEEKDVSTPQQEDGSWQKLSYLLESEDETVPELLHYYTFLYGLYPLNFMSYIRKPQRYLRHAKFPEADDLEIEPTEIRQRSEPFRQVHLLHPNFFMLTIESEITDNNRWMKSEAADVVAECMALYVPSDDGQGSTTRSRGPAKRIDVQNSDIPDQPLLDQDTTTPFQSRHTSWRNTTSTIVASPDPGRSDLRRTTSQTSQSVRSIADSPSLQPFDRNDSPTLPPTMLPPINSQLSDIISSQRSTRSSLHQSLMNDSAASLALSNKQPDSVHVDSYLASLTRDTIPRSPSLRPTTYDRSLKVAYLQREIQLLRNDLNFERYLKQQHLSHIGQLRRKQIREARAEAETQNLINSNRSLKSKLEEAKRLNLQMKKETEKSKAHSRKWESELSAKLRVLREEKKKWDTERKELKQELETATENVVKLREVVVTSERNELSAKQKVASVEISLDELERLRIEVGKLIERIRTYEAQEHEMKKATQNEEAALNHVVLLEMELKARDEELRKSRDAFDKEIWAVKANGNTNGHMEEDEQEKIVESRNRDQLLTQEILDQAVSASRHRITEIQKAHHHLLKRYTALQSAYLDLKEHVERLGDEDDEALLSGGSGVDGCRRWEAGRLGLGGREREASPSPEPSSRPLLRGDTTPAVKSPNIPISSTSYIRSPPPAMRLDTAKSDGAGERSPTSPGGGGGHHFNYLHPFTSNPGAAGGQAAGTQAGSTYVDINGRKITPDSGVRVYGRGGVQNITKKSSESSAKGKGKEREGVEGDGTGGKKKEKKGVGLRGIRGFV